MKYRHSLVTTLIGLLFSLPAYAQNPFVGTYICSGHDTEQQVQMKSKLRITQDPLNSKILQLNSHYLMGMTGNGHGVGFVQDNMLITVFETEALPNPDAVAFVKEGNELVGHAIILYLKDANTSDIDCRELGSEQ